MSKNKILQELEQEQMKSDTHSTSDAFKVGDTVILSLGVKEGDKERIQVQEGIVLKKPKGMIGSSVTIRKISFGIAVEISVPMHAPVLKKVTRKKEGQVRRARLFNLRDTFGKAAKVKEVKRAAKVKPSATPAATT